MEVDGCLHDGSLGRNDERGIKQRMIGVMSTFGFRIEVGEREMDAGIEKGANKGAGFERRGCGSVDVVVTVGRGDETGRGEDGLVSPWWGRSQFLGVPEE